MFNIKYFFKKLPVIILLLIINSISSQRLSQELLGGWNEKEISEKDPDYLNVLQSIQTYISEQGFSLDETDIIPFGFFKQIVNGINYRVLFAVKEKTSKTPTLYDINFHKSNSEMKMISAKNPEHTETTLSEKDKKNIETALIKHYFDKLYRVKEWNMEYEYHDFDGLNKYAVYDLTAELGNVKEKVSKRMIVIYRNDKTFTVETELNQQE